MARIVYGLVLPALLSCAKDVGLREGLRLDEKSFLDSINAASSMNYYKNDSSTVYSGVHGPHGPFRLRFNHIAKTALTDNGKLPQGKSMPNGSLVVKQLESSAADNVYYYMYKYRNNWLWGRINSKREVQSSIYADPSGCVNCHSQSGNRDFIVAFAFY